MATTTKRHIRPLKKRRARPLARKRISTKLKKASRPPLTRQKLGYQIHISIRPNDTYVAIEVHGNCPAGKTELHLQRANEVTFQANRPCTVTFSDPAFFGCANVFVPAVPEAVTLRVEAPQGQTHFHPDGYTPAARLRPLDETDSSLSGDPDPIIQP